jgi:hypothetical protein
MVELADGTDRPGRQHGGRMMLPHGEVIELLLQ